MPLWSQPLALKVEPSHTQVVKVSMKSAKSGAGGLTLLLGPATWSEKGVAVPSLPSGELEEAPRPASLDLVSTFQVPAAAAQDDNSEVSVTCVPRGFVYYCHAENWHHLSTSPCSLARTTTLCRPQSATLMPSKSGGPVIHGHLASAVLSRAWVECSAHEDGACVVLRCGRAAAGSHPRWLNSCC